MQLKNYFLSGSRLGLFLSRVFSEKLEINVQSSKIGSIPVNNFNRLAEAVFNVFALNKEFYGNIAHKVN